MTNLISGEVNNAQKCWQWMCSTIPSDQAYFSRAHNAQSYREQTNSWSLSFHQILFVSKTAFATVKSSIHIDKTSNTIQWFLNYNDFLIRICFMVGLFYDFKVVSHDFWTVISNVLLEGAIVVFSLGLSVACSICLNSENKK